MNQYMFYAMHDIESTKLFISTVLHLKLATKKLFMTTTFHE